MSSCRVTLALLLTLFCLPALAAEPESSADAASAPAADVDTWIENLGSDDFTTREQASRALLKVGAPAIPKIIEAAKTGFGLEVPSRSVKILAKLAKSDDEATAKAAKDGLEQLKSSDRKFVARLAESALEEEAPAPAINPLGGIGGARIVIQQNAIGGNVRIQQRVVNGQREIDVVENGTKVKIRDTNGKNIVVEVEKPAAAGQQAETKKYEAEDADDLKKKHPEAAKLYEKYAGAGNRFRAIQFRRLNVQPGFPNVRPVPVPALPRIRQRAFVPQRDAKAALDEINEAIDELQKLKQQDGVPADAIDEAVKRLEGAKQRLGEEPNGNAE